MERWSELHTSSRQAMGLTTAAISWIHARYPPCGSLGIVMIRDELAGSYAKR